MAHLEQVAPISFWQQELFCIANKINFFAFLIGSLISFIDQCNTQLIIVVVVFKSNLFKACEALRLLNEASV